MSVVSDRSVEAVRSLAQGVFRAGLCVIGLCAAIVAALVIIQPAETAFVETLLALAIFGFIGAVAVLGVTSFFWGLVAPTKEEVEAKAKAGTKVAE